MENKIARENPVDVLRRLHRERAILAQTRWAPVHNYARYDDVEDKFDDWAGDPFGNTYDAQLTKAPEVHLLFS